jgi:transposase
MDASHIAKRAFQLHSVQPETGEIVALQLKRERSLEHFANRSKCLIGMEACGGSQHCAPALQKLGHEVKLLSGRMVKPFVVGTDPRRSFGDGAQQIAARVVDRITEASAEDVVVAAMANKMARTIWALTAHERAYQSGYVSRPV